MKIAVAGCTGHLSYFFEGIKRRPDVQFSGFSAGCEAEVTAGFVDRHQKQFGFQVYENYLRMLDEEKPDVMVIASYASVNGQITLEAIRRGINVFVEKPATHSLTELEAIRKELTLHKTHLAAMLPYRYYPEFHAAYELIRNGTIGDPVLVNAQKSYKRGAQTAQKGSIIPWVGPHPVDWIYWLTGKKALSVYAQSSRVGNSNEADLDAVAACILNLEQGATAVVHMDYLRPLSAPTHGDDRIRVVGTKGIIEVKENKAVLLADGQSHELLTEEPKFMFEEFLTQIEGKGSCRVSAEDSLYVTEVCLKAELSAAEKRIVSML